MAPPKLKAASKSQPSTSTALVPTGPKEVFSKNAVRRDENGNKPLTARALVLRNGKYGSQGTGELVHMGKMSGREKLDLLAEDLIEQSKKAVALPFRLQESLNIADSQLAANLDELSDLHDPYLFQNKVLSEVRARAAPGSEKNQLELLRDSDHIASYVAARIHNAYMMAAAWRIIGDLLRDFADSGLEDRTVKSKLQRDPELRTRYLVLYDVVNIVTQASQDKFALLATTAPHYSQYFKKVEGGSSEEPEAFIFDWSFLKSVHKSFIDSLIVELCLPQSPIPRQILLQILHEAITESPREAKKFPQAVWDAMGDLSVLVKLQEIVESPLHGPDGDQWKKEPRQMPEEYENWVDAQIFSEQASHYYADFKNIIYPLSKTRQKANLDQLWSIVNKNYVTVSGKEPDELWQLDEIKQITPQWHAVKAPKGNSAYDSDDDDMPKRSLVKSKGGKKKTPLAITMGDDDDSDGSMPSLQTVSDSSDEQASDEDYSDYDDEDDEDEDGSGYDTDEEDMLRDMLREAMDTAMATPDFFDSKGAAPEFDALADERKGNPFLKLLGSLRGRMFSSSPAMKTATRTEPRRPFEGRPAGAPRQAPKMSTPKPTPSDALKSTKTTVEDVEDEDEAAAKDKKKKKKRPKKKKKKPTTEEGAAAPETPNIEQLSLTSETPATPATSASPVPSTATNGIPATPTSPSKAKKKPTPPKAPSFSSSTTLPSTSTTELALGRTETAQSAHKYLKEEGLLNGKEKIKSRADPANLASIPEKKKGYWSRFGKQDKTEEAEPNKKGSKFSFFSKLSKKTSTYMHQLLNTSEDEKKGLAPMKWEQFLKVMREMGFTYDPSTAGSSVRFDPPDPRDVPITFHRPHPDPTLYPVKLKEFGKKLKRYYGWSEEDFYKAAQ
ncbi:hypothetical protein DAEQUDRAFT_723437 [Daedalea quercina L-15889]|uniref:Uncharacterized protein n=1 Tax=Daedalea quercina L-15889 TaxID=1314783 RepID=A0A165SMX2_9APHY|nr:hypothetical protein DAEQUDRAFT_723437 [Daedalea quercina L-15889]